MTKKVLTAVLTVMLFASIAVPAHSQIIAESAVVTDYMWRGFNVLNGAPAVQPTVTGILGNTGFDVNAWFSFALRDRVEKTMPDSDDTISDLDEMDLTLTYSRDIGLFNARAGVFTYHLFTHDEYPDLSYTFVREAFAGVTFLTLPLTPWVVFNYELMEDDGYDWYLEAGLEHVLMFGKGQPVVLSAHAGWYKAEWIEPGLGGKLTDLSMTVALPHEAGRWTMTPWLSAAHSPREVINPSDFEIHAGLVLGGIFLAR